MFRSLPSQERLREYFDYNPDTGLFLWRWSRATKMIEGSPAGRICSKGYLEIGCDGHRYTAQRLAWGYMTGEDPRHFYVDHINEVKLDNRIANLQLITNRDNIAKGRKGKGYTFHRPSGRYMARIRYNGQLIHLGYYDTPEEARKAYLDAHDMYFDYHTFDGEPSIDF